jgi:hypothetical protein
MFEKVAYENYSGRRLYQWLKDRNFKTKNGKDLSLSNVYTLLRNTFYYGMFEYPKGGGKWFEGIHEPIITRELFDKVQEVLQGRYVPKTESKEFAFTRLMSCGDCHSGITAEEKFKKLKDGSVNRHVYYRCTKSKDLKCKNKPLNETKLLEELIDLIDDIELDELSIKEKITEELNRYNKFRTSVMGTKKVKVDVQDTDIRDYMKYLLQEGSILEKRELLSGINEDIVMSRKKLYLQGKLF